MAATAVKSVKGVVYMMADMRVLSVVRGVRERAMLRLTYLLVAVVVQRKK